MLQRRYQSLSICGVSFQSPPGRLLITFDLAVGPALRGSLIDCNLA